MSQPGEVRRNPETGDTYRLEQVGTEFRWVELGDEEALAAEKAARLGSVGAFIEGSGQALSFGLKPNTDITEAQRQQFPKATLAGEFLPLAAGVGAAMTGRSMAARASQQITANAQNARRLIRRPSNYFGRSTVAGQSARLVEGGMEAVPGLNVPGLVQKAINQRRTNGYFASAMGLSDEAVAAARLNVDEATAPILSMFREGYGKLRAGVNSGLINNTKVKAMGLMEEAVNAKMITPKLARALKQKAAIDADDILGVMSDLREFSRASSTPIQLSRIADDLVEQLDDVVREALEYTGQADLLQVHKVLNTRYAIWREARKGRGISTDGQLNPRTLDGRFAPRFGDNYLEGRTFKDPAANEFMQVIREGAALDVGLPSSGTAERAALGALILGGGGALANQ